jgi:hypothetical protein
MGDQSVTVTNVRYWESAPGKVAATVPTASSGGSDIKGFKIRLSGLLHDIELKRKQFQLKCKKIRFQFDGGSVAKELCPLDFSPPLTKLARTQETGQPLLSIC